MSLHHARSIIEHFLTISCPISTILAFIHPPILLLQLTCTKHGGAFGFVSRLLARVWYWFKYQTWSISSCEFKTVVGGTWRKTFLIKSVVTLVTKVHGHFLQFLLLLLLVKHIQVKKVCRFCLLMVPWTFVPSCSRWIIKNKGLLSLFTHGLWITIIRGIPSRAIYFCSV
jgi:hypothetical protein